MHRNRWITGIVLLPPLVALIAFGPPFLLALLAGLVALLGLREYFRIVFAEGFDADVHVLMALAAVAAVGLLWAAYQPATALIPAVLFLDLAACALFLVFRFREDFPAVSMVVRQVCSVVYIPLNLACLVLLYRSGDHGAAWVFLVLAVAFAGDTAAFYVGRRWGRRKLCPNVSPGKTVAGALGGVGGSMVAGALVKLLGLPGVPWPELLLFCALAAVLGQLGDMFESILKRTSGIKDSGRLLPGHGGILDRIDALLFVAPAAYLFRTLVGS